MIEAKISQLRQAHRFLRFQIDHERDESFLASLLSVKAHIRGKLRRLRNIKRRQQS